MHSGVRAIRLGDTKDETTKGKKMGQLIAKTEYITNDEDAAYRTVEYMLSDANPYVTAESTPEINVFDIEDDNGDIVYAVVSINSDGSHVEDFEEASCDAVDAWKAALGGVRIIDVAFFEVTTAGPEKPKPQPKVQPWKLCGVGYQLH